MKLTHVAILTLTAVIIAGTVPASGQVETESAPLPPGGALGTMPHGDYQCALPGDAGSEAYVEVEEENFRISTASRYTSADGAGTYLLRGRDLVFTLGPKKGERFTRVGDNQLRKLDASGVESDLLCTRLLGRRLETTGS
ncbi:MAG: elongation factor P [Pseudomonadota bacterium]